MIGSASVLLPENRILSFGGYYSDQYFSNDFFNHLWIFHLGNASWERISTGQDESETPVGRAFHSFVLNGDSTEVILFGGTNQVSLTQESQGFAGSCQLNDVWKLDAKTFQWRRIMEVRKSSFEGFDYETCVESQEAFYGIEAIATYIFLLVIFGVVVLGVLAIRFLTI